MPQIREVQLDWVAGMQFVAHGQASGATFVMDGAAQHGGGDAGLRPTEALLCGIAGCTAMDVISILRKKRQHVTSLRVCVSGEQADDHPRRFVRYHVEYILRGIGVQDQAVARAIELSQTKYCSVSASVNGQIETSYRIEEEADPVASDGGSAIDSYSAKAR